MSAKKGLTISRYFSKKDKDPFTTGYRGGSLEYKTATAEVQEMDKETKKPVVVFRQEGVEVPSNWGQLATSTIANKYFYGDQANPEERESSSKQVFGRVADFIASRGMALGYFQTREDAKVLRDELVVMLSNQVGCFNSPVLFNCGVYDRYGVESGSRGHFKFSSELGDIVEIEEGECYKHPQAAAAFSTPRFYR